MNFLKASGAVIEGSHFVYKSGHHGSVYINKEMFAFMGAYELTKLIHEVGSHSLNVLSTVCKLSLDEVGIMTPAMGAVPYALTLAKAYDDFYALGNRGVEKIKFFPAHTTLSAEFSEMQHAIPPKLVPQYQGKAFIIFEDVVNNGTTVREVKKLLDAIGARVIAVVCFVDRGGQTAESLGVEQYFPLARVEMKQDEANSCHLCKEGVHINTDLGKGKRWAELFGQPPYKEGTDFSDF